MNAQPNSNATRLRHDLLLPETPGAFARLSTLQRFYKWLWEGAPLEDEPAATDLLRVYSSLVIDSAIPHATALDCLQMLGGGGHQDGTAVRVPIHEKEQSNRVVELALHSVTIIAVHGWLFRQRPSTTNAQQSGQCAQTRKQRETALRHQFQHALSLWASSERLFLSDIGRLGTFFAGENGAEPFMIAALDSRVRPTSQGFEDYYQLRGVSRESFNRILKDFPISRLCGATPGHAPISSSDTHQTSPFWWIGESRRLLRALCRELGEAHSGQVTTPTQQANADGILDRYRMQALDIAPVDSALVLAIDYAKDAYVVGGRIKARTLRDYLDRTVIHGLLDTDASYALGDWDPDDFLEVIEERIASRRLSSASRRLILDSYGPFLRFLAKKLGLPPFSVSELREDYVAGSGQWSLISPFAIDRLIVALYEDKRLEFRQAAVIIALAYYGGLRAAEARRLGMANVVFNDRLIDLDVELLRGKTACSRRRLPLASLAPPAICDIVQDYWRRRRDEFDRPASLSSIAMFGRSGNPAPYISSSITTLTRQVLKEAFGAAATLHLLRHCFCSFLLLRWYSIRQPEILRDLRDRAHAIFQPELQQRLQRYFDCMPREDGYTDGDEDRNARPYDLTSMIKLTGHSTPEVLFQYYIHSYSVIQAHAIRQIRSPVAEICLSGKLQARLIPCRQSSASRAKYPARTLQDLSVANATRIGAAGLQYRGR